MKRVTMMLCLFLTALFLSHMTGCGDDNHAPTTREAIVFMSSSTSTNQVWGMWADGSEKTMISKDATARGIQGMVNPNGRNVVYVNQLTGTGSQIVVQDLQTDAVTVLLTDASTTGNDFAPTFSPDGTKIAYHDDRDGIHVMNSDGTGDLLLPGTDSSDHTPSWNKDGTMLVFDRGWSGDIYVMNPDGTGQTQVLAQTATTVYGHPQFLPDGRIICTSFGSASNDIVVVNADGTGLTNLTPGTDTTNEFFPTVNGDGTKIAFSTDRDGANDIYVGDFSGTTISNLASVTADVEANCWRPHFGVVDTSYVNVGP